MVIIWSAIPIVSDLVSGVISYFWNIALAIVVIIAGWIIGRLISLLVKSIVGKMRLEIFFRKISVGRAILRVGYTPSSFFATLTKGIIYMFSILSALNLLAIPLLTDSIQAISGFIPNIIEGGLILVVGFSLVDWIGETIEKGNLSTAQLSFLSNVIKILLYFVVITIALSQIKIDVTILYIFAQAFAWSLAIAIGVALGWNLKDKIGLWFEDVSRGEKSEDTP